MDHTSKRNRVLICTCVALVSGVFGAYIGGQISLRAEQHRCQTKPVGWRIVCNTWVSPGAVWQGSTTGLWISWVIGAFFSGLATRQVDKSQQVSSALTESISLGSSEIELSPDQREKLENFLVLLLLKISSSPVKKLSEDELQLLATVAKRKSFYSEINSAAARQLLEKLNSCQQNRRR